jgi:hypothetical protein
VAVFATATPSETWTLGLNGSHLRDDYEHSEMGLTGSTMNTFTLDTSYFPAEHVTSYAFYTYERLTSDQDGRQFSGGAVKLTQAADPTRDWLADHRDRVDTVGGGVTTTVIDDLLDLGVDYVFSRSKSNVEVTAGPSLTTAPLPTSITRLNSLSVHGTYRLRQDVLLKVRYRIEKFTSTDWAVDDVEPDTLANVVTLGEDSPDYTVHVVAMSFAYRF